LAIEALTVYLGRVSADDPDVAGYLSVRLTEHITDPDAPTLSDFAVGLLFLAELLVLQLANELAPDDPDHLRAKAGEVLQHLALNMPEHPE
jgi:hypothetical protein